MTEDVSPKGRTLLVTVGTTSFDALLRTVDSESFLEAADAAGFTHFVLQRGMTSSYVPRVVEEVDSNTTTTTTTMAMIKSKRHVRCYRTHPSFHEDLVQADLVISHAGAGSISESLRARRYTIVVVNESLMHNHQKELGDELARKGWVVCTTCDGLVEVMQTRAWMDTSPTPIPSYVDAAMDIVFQDLGWSSCEEEQK